VLGLRWSEVDLSRRTCTTRLHQDQRIAMKSLQVFCRRSEESMVPPDQIIAPGIVHSANTPTP
jgi:hypothetical protein